MNDPRPDAVLPPFNSLSPHEAELEAIYQSVPLGIALFDTNFRYVRVNALLADMNRLAAEDHVGRAIETVLPDGTCAVLRGFQDRLLQGEEILGETIAGSDTATDEHQAFLVSARPLRGEGQAVTHFLVTVVDITAQKRSEDHLRRSYATYLRLIEQNPFGVYLVDGSFRLAQISAGSRHVFRGIRPLIGRDFGEVLQLVWSEPFASEAIGLFRRTLETGLPYHSRNTKEQRADEDLIESYDWKIERITLPDGTFGVVCYFYDLTERNRYEEQIRLLMDEVNHRSKNMLGIVSAIARYTAEQSPGDFLGRFNSRVQALAANQDLLVSHGWSSIGLYQLVRTQLQNLDGEADARIAIEGPPVKILPGMAQTVGLVLHELASNAVRHGALSGPQGRVSLTWRIERPAEGDPRFIMAWQENGGSPPTGRGGGGFGTTVLTRMAKMSMGAEPSFSLDGEGATWRIDAPARPLLDPDSVDLLA